MTSTVRNGFTFAAITLALAGGLAVAGPAHAGAPGTPPTAARTVTPAPVSDHTSAAAGVRKIRVKGAQVALRECPRTSCRAVTRVSRTSLRASCQTNRHTTKVSGNRWWTKVTLLSGSDPAWVSNRYVRGAAPKVPHLPGC
ncbi:hypothetical protein [Streptomyces guryensis]|uniref:SH3 domain-containing protein n=1 Tax=Streptomyces guryensis TaxID=2886947 RepID=A0A9Q3Z3X1_9ACTN|nr:hypothetical protein [Streptomyces guryensis]MCD9873371.1 hypothetical protein [Streptomyces guryensis]